MSELSRKADHYWRSRTINEAQLQGYTGLRLTCAGGRITDYPFTLLLQRRGVTRHNFIGNIRFRCKSCGGKDITIGVLPEARTRLRLSFGLKAPRVLRHDNRALKGTVPAVANGGFGDTRPGPCLSRGKAG